MPETNPLTDLPSTVTESMSVSDLTNIIADVPFVTKARYQSENSIDTTPAIFTIRVTDDTTTEQLERLAVITKLTIEQLIDAEIKASIEHPLTGVTNDDGDLIDLTSDTDIELISIRWNRKMATTPSDVRHEGYAITDELITKYMNDADTDTDSRNELSHDPELITETNDTIGWFEALGSPITPEQRKRAANEAEAMGLEANANDQWITDTATFVETDSPEKAIETCREHLDITGTFRFLAALCTQPETTEPTTGK